MRNCVIWSVVLLAMVGTACNNDPKPLEQRKAAQESDAGSKTKGPAEPEKAAQEVGAAGKTEGPPKELAVDLGGGVNLELVLIPAGSFMMGDDAAKPVREAKPVHKVNITKPFYLGKYEVTQEQWEAVMGNNPSRFKGPKNPVERVSWDDCQTFLGKLNVKTGGQGSKFVLPTEAQWEYACRAGSTTTWCFGDDAARLGDYAWYDDNSVDNTHAVGQKKPNAWGLYDMHGNVWEWCEDWYDGGYYAGSPADDPSGPDTGSRRVRRGGSWLITAGSGRSAARYFEEPWLGRLFDLGFRVARAPAE